MKKVFSILAVVLFSMGLFSCTAENSADDNLYENVMADGDDDQTGGMDLGDDDETGEMADGDDDQTGGMDLVGDDDQTGGMGD